MFDGSKEGVLLRRYETACSREFHKAISDLMRLRKEAASRAEPEDEEPPLQDEPIAETAAEEVVASTGPISPRIEAVATRPATERDGIATLTAPISAPAGPVPGTV